MLQEAIVIRVRLSDFKRLKKYIKPYPNESMANYFNRVVDRIGLTHDRT